MSFKDKVVIVTGASSGMGEGIALAFAAEGAKVAMASRSIEKTDMADRVREAGGTPLLITADIGKPEDVTRIIATTREAFGRIDILVNNAWWVGYAPTELNDLSEEGIEGETATFKGLLRLVRDVLPIMREQHYGRIINITSIASKIRNPLWPVYAGLKAGVAHFSRSVAQVVAKDGITINCVGPGLTNIERTNMIFPEEAMQAMIATIPVGRVGETLDVNNAVLFFASDASEFITGQELTVCGGQAPW